VEKPLDEYATRKRSRERSAAALDRKHVHLGNAKVAIFIAALIYTPYALGNDPSETVYAILAVAFIVLAIWHEVVMRALTRAKAAVQYYDAGIARIEDRWMRDTPSGDRFRDPASPLRGFVETGRDHPYADDLDLFGPRSLFQLVSCCRTPMGEERLASWLLRPSSISSIRDRQAHVAGMRPRIDLRERIAVVNAGRRRSIDAAKLIAWAESMSIMPRLRPLIVAMAIAFVATSFVYLNGGPGVYAVLSIVANLIVLAWLAKRGNHVVESLSGATESAALDLLSNVIREIETEATADPAFKTRLKGNAASRGLARLAMISDWADSRHNVFLRLSEIPLLFTVQLAYAAESWRRSHGRHLHEWIDVVAETEALLSIAGYSFEHPADPFPELIDQADAFLEATEVSHPLLPAADAISNSLTLSVSSTPSVLIVSGSNMSGKSTLMRTVGVNTALALAGAPVRAQRLRLTPVQLGTCLRHTDSLQEHRSGFYTEALRIRAICNLLDGPLPVLFLFDELLSGTNSKDRRVAAEGVIRTLLARRAVGMVTTHDLSLTEIAAIFPNRVRNVHLQDTVVDGQMVFDYKLREGVITHSNALALMRIIGLDV
jgi:hypothetical protein